MPIGPSDFVWIGVVPCVAAAAAMFVCRRLGVRPTAAWATSVGCGLVVGQLCASARVGWQTAAERLLQPREAHDWLPWAVLVATGISIFAAHAPRSWQRWIVALAGLFAITLPIRLLAGSVYVVSHWSAGEKFAVIAVWAAAFALLWLTLAAGGRPAAVAGARGQPLLRSGLAVLVAIGMAMTIAITGSFTLGKLCGVAAATLLGATLAARTTDQLRSGPEGAAGPLAAFLGGLIMLAHFYAALPAADAVLLTVALAAAAGWLPIRVLPLPLGEGWGEGVLRTALTLVPLAVAVASAVSAALADPYR